MPQAMVDSGRKWPPSRSVVAPSSGRDHAVNASAEDQPDPRRAAMHRGVPGAGIGADADERGLAERGEPADAGEQDQAEGRDRVDADVVHQRDA